MYIVVLVTAANNEEAQRISKGVLEAKLGACCNVINSIQSHFWWEGRLDQSQEVLIIIKTKKSLFTKLAKKVKSLHTYRVPEIIALPIVAGSKDYLNWIKTSTT